MFPAEIQAEDSAQFLLHGIGGPGANRPSGSVFLVGKVNLEAGGTDVMNTRLCEGGIGPVAKARQVPGEDNKRKLALDHPFRRELAKSAGL